MQVLLEKLTVTKLLKKFQDFWNPKFHLSAPKSSPFSNKHWVDKNVCTDEIAVTYITCYFMLYHVHYFFHNMPSLYFRISTRATFFSSPQALQSMKDPDFLQDSIPAVTIPSHFSPASNTSFLQIIFNIVQPSLSWFSNGLFSIWDIHKHSRRSALLWRSFHTS